MYSLIPMAQVLGVEDPQRCFFCETVGAFFWIILAVILSVVIIGGVAAFSAFFFRRRRKDQIPRGPATVQ